MHRKITRTVGLVTLLVFSFALGFSNMMPATALSGGEFKAGRIIDDGLFYTGDTMTIAQIQSFLDAKVTTCDTQGAQGPYYDKYGNRWNTRADYGRANGAAPPYTCIKDFRQDTGYKAGESGLCSAIEAKTSRTASQIIDDVAQACHISEKALIVMLQKEQGLITDDWPWPIQYRGAMGYGCPDTAACDSQYYGFFNQVYNAARQFQRYKADPGNWNHAPFMTNQVLYQANAPSCGSRSVYIENYATAGLYNYTPYTPNQAALDNLYGTGDGCSAYGNRNFWRYYNDWFGSTQFPQPQGASLYRQLSNGKVFLVNDSTRYYVPNWDTMVNYGLDQYPTQGVSDTIIQSLADGGSLTNLVWDDNGVYLVNNRVRHHVSGSMCTAWGLSCFDGAYVKPLSSVFQLQYLRSGGPITSLSYFNGVHYKMSNGTRQPIANNKTFSDLGFSAPSALIASSLNSTQPLGTLLMTTPGVVNFSPNADQYYYDGSSYVKIGSTAAYNDWALSKITHLKVPTSSYNQTPPPSMVLPLWVKLDNKKYVIDQGRKLLVPAELGALWSESIFLPAPPALLNNLPQETLSSIIWSNPHIYLLENGNKRYIPTYDDLVGLQKGRTITNISPNKTSGITRGSDAFANGKLISIEDGGGKIYVVSNNKLIYIPNPATFDAFGFNWSKISTYPVSTLTDYPDSGQTLSHSNTGASRYLVSKAKLFVLNSSQSKDYGLIESSLLPLEQDVVKATGIPLSRFMHNTDTGRIYYASGGAIHYVATYAAFEGYGGTRSTVHSVNTSMLSLFTEGSPVY